MKKLDILVLVLAGDTKLSNRNFAVQKKTWINNNYENIKIISYSGSDKICYVDSHLEVVANDNYENLSYKTLKAFEWIQENYEFDYIFRTNTSSYIDLNNLIKFCENNKIEYLYRGKKLEFRSHDETIPYISGAEILMSYNTFKILLDNKNFWNTQYVDDVSIGQVLKKCKIDTKKSKTIEFDNSFFKLKRFNHEYHFRCRVDSPFYYPRFIEIYLMKYIHRNINKKIPLFERSIFFTFFQFSRFFAYKKHFDFFNYYLFKFLKFLVGK